MQGTVRPFRAVSRVTPATAPLSSSASGVRGRFVETGATAPAYCYLREIKTENEGLVDQTGIEPVTS